MNPRKGPENGEVGSALGALGLVTGKAALGGARRGVSGYRLSMGPVPMCGPRRSARSRPGLARRARGWDPGGIHHHHHHHHHLYCWRVVPEPAAAGVPRHTAAEHSGFGPAPGVGPSSGETTRRLFSRPLLGFGLMLTFDLSMLTVNHHHQPLPVVALNPRRGPENGVLGDFFGCCVRAAWGR